MNKSLLNTLVTLLCLGGVAGHVLSTLWLKNPHLQFASITVLWAGLMLMYGMRYKESERRRSSALWLTLFTLCWAMSLYRYITGG